MICEHCGAQMPDRAKFCTECGADLSGVSDGAQEEPAVEAEPAQEVIEPNGSPNRHLLLGLLLCGVVLLLAVLMLLVYGLGR